MSSYLNKFAPAATAKIFCPLRFESSPVAWCSNRMTPQPLDCNRSFSASFRPQARRYPGPIHLGSPHFGPPIRPPLHWHAAVRRNLANLRLPIVLHQFSENPLIQPYRSASSKSAFASLRRWPPIDSSPQQQLNSPRRSPQFIPRYRSAPPPRCRMMNICDPKLHYWRPLP